MNWQSVLLGMCLICASPAAAQHDHSNQQSHSDREFHPHEHFPGHPEAHLSHPIITESPLPESKLRFNYNYARSDDAKEHAFAAEVEYAFIPEFSVEVVLPYSFIDFTGAGHTNGFNDSEIAFKYACFDFLDHAILPAIGLAVVVPTGDDEDGIGSDHVWELEPFVRIGHWCGRWEFIGTFAAGIPLNQNRDAGEDQDFSLHYNFSVLYNITNDIRAVLELHGETLFGAEDENSLAISPGFTFQPFADKHWNFGLGVTLPLTSARESDYTINFMTIYHF